MSGMSISGVGAAYPQPGTAGSSQSNTTPQESTSGLSPASVKETEQKTLQEMLQEAREKAQQRRDALKLKTPKRYGDAPMEAYARLSRARTVADVSSAAGYARRRIIQLKAAKRQDSENAGQIQAAINQLQKAVGRAGKKRRDLEREKLSEARRLKLEQENKTRQAQRLKQELARKKTMRMIRERGYLREAEIDNRLQAQLAETRMELRAQAQALSDALTPSVDAAMQQYAAQTAPAPAAPSGGEISVQA